MPSTSSDRHSGKAAAASPDSHKANRSSKEGHGDTTGANRCSQPSTSGTQTPHAEPVQTPHAEPVQTMQPSFMASSDATNADTKDVDVSTHQVSIYVDEEIVNTAEATTTV
jgi:hypothetical protein